MQGWEVRIMEGITANQMMDAVIVVLAVLTALTVVDKAVDVIKKWRTPSTDIARKLANDKMRLDKHDESIRELNQSSQVLCAGILALLDHELHNGNADQMEKARDGIMTYLQGRFTN